MINELTIKGLKCFEEAEFHFKNLTLLAGKNSMGKSTVIQALLAMIQKGKNPFRYFFHRKNITCNITHMRHHYQIRFFSHELKSDFLLIQFHSFFIESKFCDQKTIPLLV